MSMSHAVMVATVTLGLASSPLALAGDATSFPTPHAIEAAPSPSVLSHTQWHPSRRWRPGSAFAGGVLGAAIGATVPVGLMLASGAPGVAMGGLVTAPLGAALGVHLFSDAHFGWEALGAFAGATVAVPVASLMWGTALGLALSTGEADGATPNGALLGGLVLGGAGVLVAGIGTGAWLAARINHKHRATRLAFAPTVVDDRPGLVVAGRF
ncbi:MAG: hypothetical protein JRI25_10100 [Deltaproteobacteria bacterium]|nr:hypothetical protein [Deltaproteobacteria bacterium]